MRYGEGFKKFLAEFGFEWIEPDCIAFGWPTWSRHGYQNMYDAYRSGHEHGYEIGWQENERLKDNGS